MNIVKPEKRAKISIKTEMGRGQCFQVPSTKSVFVVTDHSVTWACCIKACGFYQLGYTFQTGVGTVTLCDKDGNPEYEDAGEEVGLGDLDVGDVFTWGERVEYYRKTSSLYYNITRNEFRNTLVCYANTVTRYPNATLNLNGKAV